MRARLIGMLAAAVTLLASGGYVFVYLYRWEWNRALVSASIFITAEVGFVGWLLLERLRRMERELGSGQIAGEQRRLQVIRASAPAPRIGFSWMVPTDRSNVFIPVLLGAGAVLSGLAWVVERLARATAGRAGERSLARQLGVLDLPAGGLLAHDLDPLAILQGPVP